jgi:hypothetical protein
MWDAKQAKLAESMGSKDAKLAESVLELERSSSIESLGKD